MELTHTNSEYIARTHMLTQHDGVVSQLLSWDFDVLQVCQALPPTERLDDGVLQPPGSGGRSSSNAKAVAGVAIGLDASFN